MRYVRGDEHTRRLLLNVCYNKFRRTLMDAQAFSSRARPRYTLGHSIKKKWFPIVNHTTYLKRSVSFFCCYGSSTVLCPSSFANLVGITVTLLLAILKWSNGNREFRCAFTFFMLFSLFNQAKQLTPWWSDCEIFVLRSLRFYRSTGKIGNNENLWGNGKG